STFSFYLDRRFGYSRSQIGLLFTYIGAIMVVVQGGLVRQLVPRFGERTLIVVGTLLMGGAFFLLAHVSSLATLLLAIAVMAVGNGINTPSLSSLISRAASGEHQGGVLGVSQSMGALARVVGPMVGTWALTFG